jgi:hypothetical protein
VAVLADDDATGLLDHHAIAVADLVPGAAHLVETAGIVLRGRRHEGILGGGRGRADGRRKRLQRARRDGGRCERRRRAAGTTRSAGSARSARTTELARATRRTAGPSRTARLTGLAELRLARLQRLLRLAGQRRSARPAGVAELRLTRLRRLLRLTGRRSAGASGLLHLARLARLSHARLDLVWRDLTGRPPALELTGLLRLAGWRRPAGPRRRTGRRSGRRLYLAHLR